MTEIAAVVKRRRRPYPAYRDSGVDWLGQVPEHWEVRRLKYAAPIRNSKLGEKPESATYIGLEHIESWTGRLLTEEQPDGVESVVAEFAASDVLFGKLRPYLAKVVRPEFDGVCSTEILPLQPGSEIRQEFLFYNLLNRDFLRWIDSLTYGTKMPRVSPEQVAGTPIALPPLPEQRAIATFLDRETARIDELVAKKERLIALLQEKRAALITRAVTKGLDPNAPMKDSGVEWLGEVPEHWELQKATWLFSIGSGTTPHSEQASYYGGDIPWITTSELRETTIYSSSKTITEDALRSHSALRLHPSGSIVVAMYGATIGRLGVLGIPATVNQACCVFSEPRGILPQFWFYWLLMRRPYLISLGYGGGQPNLSQELLRSIRLPTPPLDEQEAIVSYIEAQDQRLEYLRSQIELAIARLQEYRTALISAAVTGKIDVR